MIPGPMDQVLPLYTPGQCLFCPHGSSDFADSVVHMQKAHGLFVPFRQHLAVDLECLFRYLYLVIFACHECIQCGTTRATVQAVQQHMAGKGHCNFDLAGPDAEYANFYFDADEETKTETGLQSKPLQVDDDSIRLPSGRIISKRSPAQAQPLSQWRHRAAAQPRSAIEETLPPVQGESKLSQETPCSTANVLLSKREKREMAALHHQLTSMSTDDRHSLVHLPPAQQRALLATQHRQDAQDQKEERRQQSKVDRKGNKNLYAYWHTETPVYQCG